MKLLFAAVTCSILTLFFVSCKSDAVVKTSFCDTACVKDSMKFTNNEHPLKPYVYISASNCNADSVTWSYLDKGSARMASLEKLTGKPVKLNPAAVACFIKDTSYAWLKFNDCATGRGYLLKLNFSPYKQDKALSSAINSFDPKFVIAEGIAVYSDRGNLFAEDMATGKIEQMTFRERVEIDYDNIHDNIDSVNVTPTKMWAKVLIGKDWKVFEKDITLK